MPFDKEKQINHFQGPFCTKKRGTFSVAFGFEPDSAKSEGAAYRASATPRADRPPLPALARVSTEQAVLYGKIAIAIVHEKLGSWGWRSKV